MFISSLLDTELGLSYMGGDEEIYQEVLKIYVETSEEKLPLIAMLLEEKQWKNYIIEVHALKSTSLNIGAKDLSERAKELEFAGKAENYQLIYDNTGDVLQQYRQVVDECRRYLGEQTSSDGAAEENEAVVSEASTAQIKELIEQILEECEAFDGDAVAELCDTLCGYSCGTLPLQEIFRQVKADVGEFEFTRASERAMNFLNGI